MDGPVQWWIVEVREEEKVRNGQELALRTALNGRPRAWDWEERAAEGSRGNLDALQTAHKWTARCDTKCWWGFAANGWPKGVGIGEGEYVEWREAFWIILICRFLCLCFYLCPYHQFEGSREASLRGRVFTFPFAFALPLPFPLPLGGAPIGWGKGPAQAWGRRGEGPPWDGCGNW